MSPKRFIGIIVMVGALLTNAPRQAHADRGSGSTERPTESISLNYRYARMKTSMLLVYVRTAFRVVTYQQI